MILTLLASFSALAWTYLTFFHGKFWSSKPTLSPIASITPLPSITVVVPARDEAESIATSLSSLLMQSYEGSVHVVLVDDNSTDGTAQIAASLSPQERLTILHGQPLAKGWSGKLWAVHQGLEHPLAQHSEYILLTDADIYHEPHHLATLVQQAESSQLDLVSEMVRLHCSTPAERACIPAFIFFFQMLYPFAWTADPRRSTAGAAGGTMLIRRSMVDRIGGVQSVRHQLIDDCALAQQIKRNGGRIWLGHSTCATSLRIYQDWKEIWNMIARTAYVQLRHSPLLLAGCAAGMTLLYLLPLALTAFARGHAEAIGFASWLCMAALFQPTLRRYQRSPLWGLALPLIASFYLAATIASALRHHAGRGGGWKNRTYPSH